MVFRDDPINRLEYQKSAGKPIGYLSRLDQIDINRSWDDVYNTPASIWQNDIRQPGDFIYNDYNGDGVIDDNDKVPMKLTSDPAYTYSFTLGFNYKNFGFRALFYGVAGVEKRTSFCGNSLMIMIWHGLKVWNVGTGIMWMPIGRVLV